MSKHVIVTGCLGFIGYHVTKSCLERGWKVYGVDNCTYAANLSLLPALQLFEKFSFIKEDISKISWIPMCDAIINTAAETHVGNSIQSSSEFIHSNVLGVQNLLDLIRKHPNNICDRPLFFHFSTDEVYGDASLHCTEGERLSPSNPYSASKAAAELLIQSYHRTYGLEYLIIRPNNNYGFHQYHEKLIPLTVHLLSRNKKIRLHNGGNPRRNWLHVEDTAAAVLFLIDKEVKNEVYNISSRFDQKNIDTVKKIIRLYEGADDLDFEEYLDLKYTRPGQDIFYSIDDSKLRNLGWKPQISFSDSLPGIVDFYKKRS